MSYKPLCKEAISLESTFSTCRDRILSLWLILSLVLSTHLRHDVLPSLPRVPRDVRDGGGEDGCLDARHEVLSRPQLVLAAAFSPGVRDDGLGGAEASWDDDRYL